MPLQCGKEVELDEAERVTVRLRLTQPGVLVAFEPKATRTPNIISIEIEALNSRIKAPLAERWVGVLCVIELEHPEIAKSIN